jgi:hypothetical protein
MSISRFLMDEAGIYTTISKKNIEAAFNIFYEDLAPTGNITMYTGVVGYDIFNEAMENQVGLYRVYIGKKVPRLLRKMNYNIKLSARGRWYKLVKI